MFKRTDKKYILGLLIISILYVIFTLFTYKDYGVTSDEPLEYKAGKILLHYYFSGDEVNPDNLESRHLPTQSTYFRGHLALYNLLNLNEYYEWFHLFNMIFGLFAFILIFTLIYFEYKNIYYGLFSVLFLFLTPRFLGHIPGNPKDIPFAIMYFASLVGIYILEKVDIKPTKKILILGVLFGFTHTLRLLGISIYIVYGIYKLLNLGKFDFKRIKNLILELTAILCFALTINLLLLPIVTHDPINGFKDLVLGSIKYEYWDNKMFFMGEFLSKDERPQMYLPVWISITTPLFILIPFIISPLVLYKTKRNLKIFSLFLISIFINMSLYFILKPVIYNGLRHFVFLLPLIVVISVICCINIFQSLYQEKNRKIYLSLFIIPMLIGIIFTIKSYFSLYPYIYIYFNQIVGGLPGAKDTFEMDYWGASYKEASEWIRDNIALNEDYMIKEFGDKDTVINVYSCDMSSVVGYFSYYKFNMVSGDDVEDYIICDYETDISRNNFDPIVKIIQREGVPLNIIRKVPHQTSLNEKPHTMLLQ